MAVYHFTLHAYRSWMPDRRRGYVRRNKVILPPDKNMAQSYNRLAKDPAVVFTKQMQEILIAAARDKCAAKNWRLHAIATDNTRVHMIISWRTFMEWNQVINRIKNIMSYRLGKELKNAVRQ